MELANQYTALVQKLKDLARELRIRNPAKLLQAARGKISGANPRLPSLALEDSTSKQALAPAFRSTGKTAAAGPNEPLQADLIDYSANTWTKERFALMLSDVYTREVRAVPLMNTKPETVNAAMRRVIPTLVQDKKDFALTTDAGKEFSTLEMGDPNRSGT